MKSLDPLTLKLLQEYEFAFKRIATDRTYPGDSALVFDYKAISNATEADLFFSKFGVGNTINAISLPFERQFAYELLLEILKSINPNQYDSIHKGTPYYFIGWTAYQYRDFAKGIFYMDAAVSEDLKFTEVQNKISTKPSLDFFLLKSDPGPSALATHIKLREIVENSLQTYHTNGGGIITIDDFRNKFIDNLLYAGSKERSLLTALYTLLLEYSEKEKQINLRSNTGGSIQPFIDHLFDGARLLESLLEKKGGSGNTLRPKIVNASHIAVSPSTLTSGRSLIDAENEFKKLSKAGETFQDCNFASAYIIRNTTGHSLLWPDQFTSTNSYSTLYNNLINSIFWTIEKLWL